MSVTIDATNYVVISSADTHGDFSGVNVTPADGVENTREGTSYVAAKATAEVWNLFVSPTAADYSDRTIFGWIKSAAPAAEGDATGAGFEMFVGDGTNARSHTCGGSDNFGFFFQGWASFRLNVGGLPTTYRQISGGAITLTAINRIGMGGYFPPTATGNSNNVGIDQLAYVANTNPALLIEGGTTGARGTWEEVATEDADSANAWGVCRSLLPGGKAYEVTFGVHIGENGTAASYFEDADFQVFLNGSVSAGGVIEAGSMDLDFIGNSTGTNLINFDNFLFQGIGAVSNFDASDTNIDELIWSNGQFVDLGTFVFQAQDAGQKTLTNLIWTNCGQVSFVGIDAAGCTFNGSTNANGAVLWSATVADVANQGTMSFTSDGTGHAIEITLNTASLTTYAVSDLTVDGYAGQSGTAGNTVFYIDNALDGDVTINITDGLALNTVGGGTGFSYEKAAGYTGTVTINTTIITLSVTVLDATDDTPLTSATVQLLKDSDKSVLLSGAVNGSGVLSDTITYDADTDVVGWAREHNMSGTDYTQQDFSGEYTVNGFAITIRLEPAE